jgi:endonuclease/exonuclease/phosphatase (EEP) superfamily protein YafD
MWLVPLAVALALPFTRAWWPSDPGTVFWLFDLAVHWQWLWALLWLGTCLTGALRDRRWLLLAPAALLPLWSASPALPRVGSDAAPPLIVIAANVHVGNRDPAPLVAWLRARPADAVVLTELTPAYAAALVDALGDDYPHRALHPADSAFGIGLIARQPLSSVAVRRSADGIPRLEAWIAHRGASVRIVALHPMPPLSPYWHRERDALLHEVGAGRDETPSIVAGDLNATPWSSAFAVAAQHGLHRAGGLAPTWPRRHVGIPIDHVLADTHWRRGAAERGPDIGSDHLPFRVALHRADPER